MKNMSKYEQILAQKTIDSRRIRNESKRLSTGSLARTLSPNKTSSFNFSKDLETRPFTSSNSQSSFNLSQYAPETNSGRLNQSSNQHQHPNYSNNNSSNNNKNNNNNNQNENHLALTNELSQRGLTQEAALRKMTNDARIKISKQYGDLNTDNDIFLPKVRKLRPDGASLGDVYRSKKEDVWGKILHEQLVEEEQKNYEKLKKKEHMDSVYGIKLKEQIILKRQMDTTQNHSGDFMANATGGTWEQFEARNRERETLRATKHAEFVNNALHDMTIKKSQKMEALQQELTSSAYLVKKAQMEIEREKELARLKKEEEAKRMERLWNENQQNLIQKQKEREKKHEMDRKYVQELEEKFQREEERRQYEVAKKAATNSTDRSAFILAQKVVEESKRKQNELLTTIIQSENSLSRQLKASEDAAHERQEKTKKSLREEFLRQKQLNTLNRDTKSDDQMRIKLEMDKAEREFLKSQERQRKAKQDAADRYQQLLDKQLAERREKSLVTLKETMAPREKEMNSELFRKYGIQLS